MDGSPPPPPTSSARPPLGCGPWSMSPRTQATSSLRRSTATRPPARSAGGAPLEHEDDLRQAGPGSRGKRLSVLEAQNGEGERSGSYSTSRSRAGSWTTPPQWSTRPSSRRAATGPSRAQPADGARPRRARPTSSGTSAGPLPRTSSAHRRVPRPDHPGPAGRGRARRHHRSADGHLPAHGREEVCALMDQLGAGTRFQAGVHAPWPDLRVARVAVRLPASGGAVHPHGSPHD